MLAGTACTEDVHHGFERRKRRSVVGPRGFTLAWYMHLHRCFIGMNQALVLHVLRMASSYRTVRWIPVN